MLFHIHGFADSKAMTGATQTRQEKTIHKKELKQARPAKKRKRRSLHLLLPAQPDPMPDAGTLPEGLPKVDLEDLRSFTSMTLRPAKTGS